MLRLWRLLFESFLDHLNPQLGSTPRNWPANIWRAHPGIATLARRFVYTLHGVDFKKFYRQLTRGAEMAKRSQIPSQIQSLMSGGRRVGVSTAWHALPPGLEVCIGGKGRT